MGILELLKQSRKNFEALDAAMRTPGVPGYVAKEAFAAGMRDLSASIELLEAAERGE